MKIQLLTPSLIININYLLFDILLSSNSNFFSKTHHIMGGNTFGEGRASRLDQPVYDYVLDAFINKETGIVTPFSDRAADTKSVLTKKSHGDIDIQIVPNKEFNIEPIIELVKESKLFDFVDYKKGAGEYHFLIMHEEKEYQIDIITCGVERFDLLDLFNSYSIVGIIIGLMCSRYGMSFGPKGLGYKHHKIKTNFVFGTDCQQICDFLRLDYKTFYNKKFADNTEMFNWLKQCKFYHPISLLYSLEQMIIDRKQHKQDRMAWIIKAVRSDVIASQIINEEIEEVNEKTIMKAKARGNGIAKFFTNKRTNLLVNIMASVSSSTADKEDEVKEEVTEVVETKQDRRKKITVEAAEFFGILEEFNKFAADVEVSLETRKAEKAFNEEHKASLGEKYNPKIINEVTGLEGLQIGIFYKNFIQENPKSTLVNIDADSIKKLIIEYHLNDWPNKWAEESANIEAKRLKKKHN